MVNHDPNSPVDSLWPCEWGHQTRTDSTDLKFCFKLMPRFECVHRFGMLVVCLVVVVGGLFGLGLCVFFNVMMMMMMSHFMRGAGERSNFRAPQSHTFPAT